jgi:hypothetical protein
LAVELQEDVLRREQECKPVNTRRAYGHCQKEWSDWCAANAAPMPNLWPPAAPWQGPLPGDLADEQKMLLFMDYVTKREPKKGKRQQQRPRRQQVAELQAQKDEEDAEKEVFSKYQITLKYNSVRGYISALQALYDQRVLIQHNPAPKPQGLGLKCLERYLTRSKWAKNQR